MGGICGVAKGLVEYIRAGSTSGTGTFIFTNSARGAYVVELNHSTLSSRGENLVKEPAFVFRFRFYRLILFIYSNNLPFHFQIIMQVQNEDVLTVLSI